MVRDKFRNFSLQGKITSIYIIAALEFHILLQQLTPSEESYFEVQKSSIQCSFLQLHLAHQW